MRESKGQRWRAGAACYSNECTYDAVKDILDTALAQELVSGCGSGDRTKGGGGRTETFSDDKGERRQPTTTRSLTLHTSEGHLNDTT